VSSKRRGPERLPFGAPFHPLNYEISHGKFFSPRAGSSRIPSCRRRGRVRSGATKIDDGGLRRPDTVPHLLIERINQRFHPPAPRYASSFLPSSLFPLPPFRDPRRRSQRCRSASGATPVLVMFLTVSARVDKSTLLHAFCDINFPVFAVFF